MVLSCFNCRVIVYLSTTNEKNALYLTHGSVVSNLNGVFLIEFDYLGILKNGKHIGLMYISVNI